MRGSVCFYLFVFSVIELNIIEDLWAAYCASTETVLNPSTWFDNAETIIDLKAVDEDVHAQIATWLLARVINLVYAEKPVHLLSSQDYDHLRHDMYKWEAMGSKSTESLIYRHPDRNRELPFPRVVFASHSASEFVSPIPFSGCGWLKFRGLAIGHTMFRTAMVLLLEYERSIDPSKIAILSNEIYENALLACGIIDTNDDT